MVNKNRRHACLRRRKKSYKRVPLPQLASFVCPTCTFRAIDSYDLSHHLRGNTYCNKKNTTSLNSGAAAFPLEDISSPDVFSGRAGDDDDDFMFDADDGVDVANETLSVDCYISEDGQAPSKKYGVIRVAGNLSSREYSSDNSSTAGGDDNCSIISYPLPIPDDASLSVSDPEGSDDDDNEYDFYDETSFPSGVDDVVHVSLADLCHRIKAPLYAYNHILRWAQDAKAQGYSFPVEAPQYNTFISQLKKRLDVEDYSHRTETVEAAGGGTVSFPVFDFQSMFLSLIDDHRIKGHLLVNWDSPWLAPPFERSKLDEIHSGDWYRDTTEKLITIGSNEILCGIILAIDRTHVADKEKLSLEPVLFSLSIIPRSIRNHPYAWRPLGFMPPKPSISKGKGFNASTYHSVLGKILSGLVRAQKNGGINCGVMQQVDADGVDRQFTFKVPLAFVIGDVEGHDVLCGRFKTHNTHMLSRECNCTLGDADNHLVKCQYICASDLKLLRESNNMEALHGMCFHNIHNAFDKVCFGANEYGIHRATMSEVLHAIQKGWYLYTLSGLYDLLSGEPLNFLDCLARRVSRQCRHQSDRDFPRLSFSNGIRSYKLMHAHEISGLLLLITMCLYCRLGYDTNHTSDLTKNSFIRNTSCRRQIPRLKKFRQLIQMLLCMEAWMKEDSIARNLVRRNGVESKAKDALRIAMENYVKVVRRTTGHGLKHVKTHSVLHVSDDILRFGSPNNWNTARVESGHKFHAKYPALRTQRRKDRLEDQVCKQTTNLLALTIAKDLIGTNSQNNLLPAVMDCRDGTTFPAFTGGSHFLIKVTQSGKCLDHEWLDKGKGKSSKKSKTTTACSLLFDSHVYDRQMRFVADVIIPAIADDITSSPGSDLFVPDFDIECFTEIKVVDNGVSNIYRGHPSYHGEDPWHDWVYVKWLGEDGSFSEVPGEIQFFVKISHDHYPNARNIDGYRGQGTYAVLQSMEDEPTSFGDSILLSYGKREKDNESNNVFHFQNVDTFVRPAFVVDNIGCQSQSLFVVRPRSEWSGLFL